MNNTLSSNPWPGLGSYDDTRRYKFCGRSKATNELYSLIADNNVISLYGRSGIGKTSLLKAGVTPLLLRRGFMPIYVRLSQEAKTPDDSGRTLSFAECIVRCIESKMQENGCSGNAAPVKTTDADNPDFLWSYFCKNFFQSLEGKPCIPVVILDQYEEIFQGQREKAALLMRQLYGLVDDSRRLPDNMDYDEFRDRFRFVMSFRDDSLYRLEDVINEYNLTAFKENRYLLKALSRNDATDVIMEPREGLVTEEVSNQILDKVVSMSEGNSADPAILSLLMYGLYDRMIAKGHTAMSSSLVDEAGEDVVHSFYEQGMLTISVSARKYLEEHLVSSDGRRRAIADADLRQHVDDKELKLLLDKHILAKIERGRYTDYELTHDVLCPIVAASHAEALAKEKIARNKRMIKIMAGIMALVFAIVAVFFTQNKRLKEQRWTALGNQSRFMAEKSMQLAEDGDAYLAKLLLINTMPTDLDKPDRPLTAESSLALGTIFDYESGILGVPSNWVRSVSFSPDGKTIVSASQDSTLKIWDAQTGDCLKTLVGHTDRVHSASFSPDGKTIVSASSDRTVRIWDAQTRDCLKTLVGHTDRVLSASFSPDGKTIVSASDDRTVRIGDAQTGDCLKTLEGHSSLVNSASFSPDGKTIVSASWDKTVKIWDAQAGNCLKTLEGHTGLVLSASFSPDGKTIVSASYDRTVRIWDAQTGDCLKTLEGHSYYVNSASFSPDGKTIVSASSDRTVRIWDAQTRDCLKTLVGHTDGVHSASFSPDGKTIVSASSDRTVRIWDAQTGVCLETLEGHSDWVRSASFSPDGKTIVSGSYDGTSRIWYAQTGDCLKTLEGMFPSFSPDGKTIVSVSDDETVRIWDAQTGDCLKTLEGHTSGVYSASFSPDGKTIISDSDDGTMKIWDAETGEGLNTLEGHSASFSPDGKTIVSASDDETVKIWDAETGDCLKTLEGHTDRVFSASFSPDGKTIVSVSMDRTVKIWDAETGDCLKTLEGHTSGVYSASFSPDGKTIISDSDDGTMKIWDAETGDCLKTLEGRYPSFSPDGKTIVSASSDGTLKIWKAIPSLQEMLDITRERFKNRQLTEEERHQYYLE